jgi:hypothetical protein
VIRRLRSLLLALLAISSLGAGVRPDGLGDVRSISVEKSPTRTRVVIELSRKSPYSVNEL